MAKGVVNEKFNSLRQIVYSEAYINALRENVKRVCNHLDPNKHFDFESSKENFAYEELWGNLVKKKYPEIDKGTLRNFFRKESKSKIGGKVFRFQEKTIAILEDFVDKFLPKSIHVMPHLESPFEKPIDNKQLDDTIKQLLYQIYIHQEGIWSSHEKNIIDENGNCKTIYKVSQEAISNISHILFETFMDLDGKIEILEAIDHDKKENLKVYTYQETKDAHSFFVLFSEMKTKGARFNYSVTVNAEKYFSDLIENKKATHENMAFVFKYKGLIEEFIFPDIATFKTLKVVISQHPNKALINKAISPTINANMKSYKINHGNLENWSIPIIIQFTLE